MANTLTTVVSTSSPIVTKVIKNAPQTINDITGVTITTSSTSGLSGGATATSGAFSSTLVISPNSATSATVASADIVLIGDADDSNAVKKTTVADIVALAPAGVSLGLVLALS